MAPWLIVVLVGVVLIVLGIAIEAAQVILWIGLALLAISLVGWLAGRGRSQA